MALKPEPAICGLTIVSHWKSASTFGWIVKVFESAVTKPSAMCKERPDSALYPVASTLATPAVKCGDAVWNPVLAKHGSLTVGQPLVEPFKLLDTAADGPR